MERNITKKITGILLSAIVVMVAVIVLNYTQEGKSYQGRDAEPEYVFTFVCPLRWTVTAYGIENADAEFHANTKLVGSGQLNTSLQAQAIQEAIATKPDGIITAGMEDSQILIDAIDQASSAGIPVVLVDNDLPQTRRISYIGSDNQKLGELTAEKMVDLTGGEGQVCLIVSNLDNANQQERVEGFQNVLKDYPDLQISGIMECASEPLEVREQYMEFIAENPDTTAVCCLEGRAAKEIGNILDASREERPYVVAVDYNTSDGSRPQEEIYGAIFKQDMEQQGYLAVRTLVNYLQGKAVEEIQYTDIACYDQENLENIKDVCKVYDWRLY